MGINEIIMYIMMFFMLIAAVDRILSQFGGSARFLGKFGKSIEGAGGQFEEGFMAMGALGLAMVGMTALAPVLAHVLGPVIIPVYEMLGANRARYGDWRGRTYPFALWQHYLAGGSTTAAAQFASGDPD